MGSSVAASRRGTATKNAFLSGVPTSIPPKTHCSRTRRPTLYLRRQNRLSSISTTMPGPPTTTGFARKCSPQMSRQKLFQSTSVWLLMSSSWCSVSQDTLSCTHRYTSSTMVASDRWLSEKKVPCLIDSRLPHGLPHRHAMPSLPSLGSSLWGRRHRVHRLWRWRRPICKTKYNRAVNSEDVLWTMIKGHNNCWLRQYLIRMLIWTGSPAIGPSYRYSYVILYVHYIMSD